MCIFGCGLVQGAICFWCTYGSLFVYIELTLPHQGHVCVVKVVKEQKKLVCCAERLYSYRHIMQNNLLRNHCP